MPDPAVFAHLQCGIDPQSSRRMDCDVIDVNSAPDESAKESSYFHVHGLISVACLVFAFLLWSTLLTCSGHTSVTTTSLSFLEAFGLPTLFFFKYLAN